MEQLEMYVIIDYRKYESRYALIKLKPRLRHPLAASLAPRESLQAAAPANNRVGEERGGCAPQGQATHLSGNRGCQVQGGRPGTSRGLRKCHFRQPGGQSVLRTAPDLAEPSPQARKSGRGKFTSPTRTDQS